MIISHKNKFIFIKTRKTAGTSIEIALSRFCGEHDIITTIDEKDELIRRTLGYSPPRNYFIPYSRYSYSNWKDLILKTKRQKYYNHIPAQKVRYYLDKQIWNSYYKFCFVRNPFDKILSFYDFYKRRHDSDVKLISFMESNFSKLCDFNLYTTNKGEILVDKIYKYEDLNYSLRDIEKKCNIPSNGLDLSNIKAKTNIRKTKIDSLSHSEISYIKFQLKKEFLLYEELL